jgi:putative N-acetyltransferase (TIGR04045 family)
VSRPSPRIARSEEELAAHHAVRTAVFVDEQRIFEDTDLDHWDASALRVIAERERRVVGAVRLYPLDDFGLWKGDRLAVLPEARLRVGAELVRFAVRTAGARGGQLMLANVQAANVVFFERLGWSRLGAEEPYRGIPHQRMSIGLAGVVPSAIQDRTVAWMLG